MRIVPVRCYLKNASNAIVEKAKCILLIVYTIRFGGVFGVFSRTYRLRDLFGSALNACRVLYGHSG